MIAINGRLIEPYKTIYDKGYQQGRADAIDDCLVLVDKIMPSQPFLLKSKHYENWKMKTTELRMLRDMLEQLKEQKNDISGTDTDS